MTTTTDRIERSTFIKAPRAKVWQSLADAETFGQWFGANLKGQTFAVGERVRGPITICEYEHVTFDVIVERMEPERLFAWRWHPYAIDPAVDYAKEPRTLVTFELKDADGGTLLTVVESGFDGVPPSRRLEAFRMNSAGWDGQLKNLGTYATTK
jgi:uncharacterized protein YndB with AHSA1/START domain